MKNKLLLPRICRPIGCIIFPLGIAWLIAFYFGQHSVFPFLKYNINKGDGMLGPGFLFSKDFSTDFNGELSILFTLFSLFMIAFSREKVEDEYVSNIRLHALQVSVYLSFLALAIASFLFYGFTYVYVLQINLYSIPIIFILVFNFNLYIKPRLSKKQTI